MLPQIYVPVVKIKELPTPERKLINEVISVCKLILVNPTTSASVERSFPQLPEDWLRSTMTQERFTNLTILNSQQTNRLSLVDLANEFSAVTITEGEIVVSLKILI